MEPRRRNRRRWLLGALLVMGLLSLTRREDLPRAVLPLVFRSEQGLLQTTRELIRANDFAAVYPRLSPQFWSADREARQVKLAVWRGFLAPSSSQVTVVRSSREETSPLTGLPARVFDVIDFVQDETAQITICYLPSGEMQIAGFMAEVHPSGPKVTW